MYGLAGAFLWCCEIWSSLAVCPDNRASGAKCRRCLSIPIDIDYRVYQFSLPTVCTINNQWLTAESTIPQPDYPVKDSGACIFPEYRYLLGVHVFTAVDNIACHSSRISRSESTIPQPDYPVKDSGACIFSIDGEYMMIYRSDVQNADKDGMSRRSGVQLRCLYSRPIPASRSNCNILL